MSAPSSATPTPTAAPTADTPATTPEPRVVTRQPVIAGKFLPWTARIVLFGIVLGLWQWYGSTPDSFAIASVTEVAAAMWAGLVGGEFLLAAGGTILTMLVGYSIAAVLGVGFGLFIGVSRYARNALEPLVHAGYATPISLLIPIIGIYTGLEFRGRVILTVLWCVFEILVNTTTGIREVPAALVDVGRAFNMPRRDLYRKIILPAAMPYIMLGLRIGVGRAIRGAVTAELLLSAANLGELLLTAGSTFDVPKLLAGIIFTMILGLVLMYLAAVVERRAMAYRTT
jgi:NitT/TauT family transport system permease protein